MMLRIALVALALAIFSSAQALAGESNAAKIQRALSAAPSWLRANATVVDIDAKGKATVLRSGSNGFTCIPGTPGVIGRDPVCADAQSMIWMQSMMTHKPKPANTRPGVAYMLAGGADYSTTDPWATAGKRVYRYPPHWMILWPFDPKTSGLSTKYSASGSWIMYAGTPYAHLMIIQRP